MVTNLKTVSKIHQSEMQILKTAEAVEISSKYARKKGKHQMAACCACKKKRKKCDGKYPICSGCLKSNTECTIIDNVTKRVIPRNYLQVMEDKIRYLEGQLAMKDLQTSSDAESRKISVASSDVEEDNLETEVGYMTLGVAAESPYIGDSSAFSIARAITGSINYYKHERVGLTNHSPVLENYEPPFSCPSRSTAAKYLSTYKQVAHCQYPFLEWSWVEQCFAAVISNTPENASDEALFFMYMIFAIGAQVSTSGNQSSINPYIKMYYTKAMSHISPILDTCTIRTVQAYLILSVFSQKMPSGASIWQSTGLAIRTAVALGLHREPFHKTSMPPEVQKLRSQVFWCAYGLERINGIVLGRPFGIADIDIDAPTPKETPEFAVAAHVIKLRRIQSSICTFVYKPVAIVDSESEIDATRMQIMLELNDWMRTFPWKSQPVSGFETENWCRISYNNSTMLLLRPVVLEVSQLRERTPERSVEWFKVFTQSASAICINYKELHCKGKMGYTWLAMHCIFVAGLSFLYCLWLDYEIQVLQIRRRVIYDTVSACTSVLHVMAERFSAAAVFRDTFERISNAVLMHIETEETAQSVIDVGIDQYLGSEGLSLDDELDTNVMWEFLDNTGDKFLRDIYSNMESTLEQSFSRTDSS